jgi:predicted permease
MINLDTRPFRIIGVADQSFFGVDVGRTVQVYAPLCSEAIIRGAGSALDRRSTWWLNLIGRPKADMAPEQVRAGLKRIAPASYESTVPPNWGVKNQKEYREGTFDAVPAGKGMSQLRRQYRTALFALMSVVGVVLLVACANVANLLLARATARQREIAIRLAIGAGRGRLVRQLLTESVLLSALGAGVGVLFARWGSQLLVRLLSTSRNTVSLDLSLDMTVLAFTVAVAMATGVLFGLAPAWRSSRVNPQAAMKAGGRGVAEGHSRFSIAKALVTAQIALSLVLVVSAGLLLGSFTKLANLDPGFRPAGVLVVTVDARNASTDEARRGELYQRMLERARALPGVTSASIADLTPISGSSWNDEIYVDGLTLKSGRDALVYFNRVSDRHFTTMGTALVAGRDFGAQDTPESPQVAIVNDAMAKKFFAGSAIGKHFRIKEGDALQPLVEIVGVVKDAKYKDLREETLPTAYYAATQIAKPGSFISFVLRGDGSALALTNGFKSVAAEADPRLSLRFVSLEEQLATSLTRERLLATLSGFFGALALLLATIGLYGIMSYNVARRRSEIGVRIALGAARPRVVRMVLGEVGRMVVIGLAIGGVAAAASTRLMKTLLYGLSPSDPTTLAASGAVLLVVALAAGLVPALRASRLDPMDALREE